MITVKMNECLLLDRNKEPLLFKEWAIHIELNI